MRFLLFALMIALLPLRGWVGDAMATEMAPAQLGQPGTIKNVAHNTHGSWTKDHFYHESVAVEALHGVQTHHEAQSPKPPLLAHDCAGQASADHGQSASTACDSCAACQACHTVAIDPQTRLTGPAFNTRTLPGSAATLFASADTARGQKPPIS